MVAVNAYAVKDPYDFLIWDTTVYPVKSNGRSSLPLTVIIAENVDPASMYKLLEDAIIYIF